MTQTARHPGRRPPASNSATKTAERKIRKAIKRRDDIKAELDSAQDDLAQEISDAMAEGVETNFIATLFASDEKPDGITRQMVYKIVRERVDKKPMAAKAATNGGSKKKSEPKKQRQPAKRSAPAAKKKTSNGKAKSRNPFAK